jgi:D-beta-D-heptose 7-phosphate kinase/D-beta-D-heptose 1-phosphate adenosyltransferase|tara:strand:- start:655 stop:1149 length:495 start_codon:yes stop_codon:yes gene_type:complete
MAANIIDKDKTPTVMVSGGFDPVHVGHIRMIRDAAQYGDVIVVANSDQWLHRKKGFVFMEFDKRSEILSAIKGVIVVDSVDDTDGTVCEAILRHKPDFFANGGDRGKSNTPEQSVCEEIGVELLWEIGGDYKADASSNLVERFRKNTEESDVAPQRTEVKHSMR